MEVESVPAAGRAGAPLGSADGAGEAAPLARLPGRSWRVLHTRGRAEKALREKAAEVGIPAFLPVLRKRSRWKDRVAEVDFPLFPGYLFAALGPEDGARLKRTRFVANILAPADEETLLAQLSDIALAMESGRIAAACGYLAAGRKVRVVAGPLLGAVGRIDRRRGGGRLVLSVDYIRRSVEVEIGEDEVEECEEF